MAESMVERVAKALAAFWHNDWSTMSEEAKRMYRGAADAALRARSDPDMLSIAEVSTDRPIGR